MKYVLAMMLAMSVSVANATFIDNGTYTTDTEAGLDWLDITTTLGESINSAPINNPGWRLATNSEVVDMFNKLVPDFVSTGAPGLSSALGDDAQNALAGIFYSLFGGVEMDSRFGRTEYGYGLYVNAIDSVRRIGWYHNTGRDLIANTADDLSQLTSPDYTWSPSRAAAWNNISVLIVRETSAVPEPGTLALFGLGLAGMGFSRCKKTAFG